MVEFMKSIKRVVVITLVSLMLLHSGIGSAQKEMTIDEARQIIQQHIKEDKWDLLGWKGEDLYFELRNQYSQGSKVKELEFDIKMIGTEKDLTSKAIDDNAYIYVGLASIAGYGHLVKSANVSTAKKVDTIKHLLKKIINF